MNNLHIRLPVGFREEVGWEGLTPNDPLLTLPPNPTDFADTFYQYKALRG